VANMTTYKYVTIYLTLTTR